jgi:signal transduction histidine kinase
MQRVLADFRRLSTGAGLEFRRIDLVPVLKSVVTGLKNIISSPIETTFGGGLMVLGDPNALNEVLTELIENAAEAMESAKTKNQLITVRAWADSTGLSSAGTATVEVTDTGPGIRKDDKSRIFQPLFSTKARGSGLGLMKVWDIIEQHNGSIVETGSEGKGARFVIRLPLA